MPQTPHMRAEAELTAYGLTLPEAYVAPGFGPTRFLEVRRKGFAVFGDKGEPETALTITVKLPISAEMVQHLPFVREGSAWYRRNNWVIAHFGPQDDPLAELDTLKGWLKQSYLAVAPKALARLLA